MFCIKNLYEKFGIEETEDFINFFQNINSVIYGFYETQANLFANYFLIPRDILYLELEKEFRKKRKELANKDIKKNIADENLIPYIADSLAKKFQVSNTAMEMALKYKD